MNIKPFGQPSLPAQKADEGGQNGAERPGLAISASWLFGAALVFAVILMTWLTG